MRSLARTGARLGHALALAAVALLVACGDGPTRVGAPAATIEGAYRLVRMDDAPLPLQPFGATDSNAAMFLDSATIRFDQDSALLRSDWRQMEGARMTRQPVTTARAGVAVTATSAGARIVLSYAHPGTVLPGADTGTLTGTRMELRSRAYGVERVVMLVFERAGP